MFPPHCPLCHQETMQVHRLCASCWPKIDFLQSPFCDVCSEPFQASESGYSGPLVCGNCTAYPPSYDRLRAALLYTPASRDLILKFKHLGQDGLRDLFQPWLQPVAEPLLKDVDIVVPVPIHWTRLWKRNFNQAAILAKALTLPPHVTLLLDGLHRFRRTKPLGRLNQKERRNILKGTIRVNPNHLARIQNKRILIIDDVAASGTTLNICSKALKRAGATDVSALVLARSSRNLMSPDETIDF